MKKQKSIWRRDINEKYIYWILVIIWAGIIFLMSSMDTNEYKNMEIKIHVFYFFDKL